VPLTVHFSLEEVSVVPRALRKLERRAAAELAARDRPALGPAVAAY
jgi:hypothetical protein